MNREILMSILVIGVLAVLLSSSTISFFSDVDVSKNNVILAGDLDLRFVAPGECKLAISFLHEDSFAGVDSPNGWSTGDGMVNLGTDHWSLLDGTADVYAYRNGDSGTLTHRGTRGLGVNGGENDEIDNVNREESIVITFDIPQYLCKFEVRSLFAGETNGDEYGDVKLYLHNSQVGYYHLQAVEAGGDGILEQGVPDILVDKIIFYLENGNYNGWSEYAVARIYLSGECVQDDEFYGRVGAVWEMYDIKPGMETDGTIVLNDMGSNHGGRVKIICNYTAAEDNDGNPDNGLNPGPEPDTDLTTGSNEATTDAFASYMEITNMTYYSDGAPIDLLPTVDDINSNGWKDIYDLKHDSQIVTLNSNGANGDNLYMKIKFHENAGNEYQGDIFYLDMIFTLQQKGMPP